MVRSNPRVVFDTNVVLSALLFPAGRLAWLRAHWREARCLPLISRATANELIRVLSYSKFRLSARDYADVLGLYLPYCATIEPSAKCPVQCRDAKDQPLLDLAHCGNAGFLITGDGDLLALADQTSFVIETPMAYRLRTTGEEP